MVLKFILLLNRIIRFQTQVFSKAAYEPTSLSLFFSLSLPPSDTHVHTQNNTHHPKMFLEKCSISKHVSPSSTLRPQRVVTAWSRSSVPHLPPLPRVLPYPGSPQEPGGPLPRHVTCLGVLFFVPSSDAHRGLGSSFPGSCQPLRAQDPLPQLLPGPRAWVCSTRLLGSLEVEN